MEDRPSSFSERHVDDHDRRQRAQEHDPVADTVSGDGLYAFEGFHLRLVDQAAGETPPVHHVALQGKEGQGQGDQNDAHGRGQARVTGDLASEEVVGLNRQHAKIAADYLGRSEIGQRHHEGQQGDGAHAGQHQRQGDLEEFAVRSATEVLAGILDRAVDRGQRRGR